MRHVKAPRKPWGASGAPRIGSGDEIRRPHPGTNRGSVGLGNHPIDQGDAPSVAIGREAPASVGRRMLTLSSDFERGRRPRGVGTPFPNLLGKVQKRRHSARSKLGGGAVGAASSSVLDFVVAIE